MSHYLGALECKVLKSQTIVPVVLWALQNFSILQQLAEEGREVG